MSEGIDNQGGAPRDASEDESTNPSGNRAFHSVLATAIERRTVLKGVAAGTVASQFLAPLAHAGTGKRGRRPRELVGFEPVSIAQGTVDQTLPTISRDYEYQVLIPWGTPIEPGATAEYNGDPNTRPTSQEAAKQIGIGHDGIAFFPIATPNGRRKSSSRGMLCVNHEFGRNSHVLGKSSPESLEDVRLAQNVLGVSVVALRRVGRHWSVVSSPNSRRITVNTPMAFSGPAAASERLQNPNGNIALGTVNNCGSGITPWGTYLTCEENFNGYFGATEGETFNDSRTEEQLRYGFDFDGFGYGWEHFDRRFDLSDPDYVNESNRFGWVVEIDPYDGTQKPVKRTALGRFKHEAVTIATAPSGRVAVYMGDDQRFDYCYKFVSDKPWKQAVDAGESPLDEGRLYVARFDDDGTGEWLELTIEHPDLQARFADQAEVLINARIAADILGATPMDRPEWATVSPDGSVFWTMTNNTARTVADAANPQAPNPDGHIIRTHDSQSGLGTTFDWDIYLLASATQGTEGVFTDPDAAYADPFGRLFIGTDGGQPDGLQDQLVVLDTTKDIPEPKRLLVGVQDDEVTGWAYTPDFRTAFTNLQHPGNGDPTRTNFPAPFDGKTVPRDATLVLTRKNRGVIGS